VARRAGCLAELENDLFGVALDSRSEVNISANFNKTVTGNDRSRTHVVHRCTRSKRSVEISF